MKRQIAMSFGFELARYPEAISDLIIDEQIKVTGCRFASSPFTPLLNDIPLRCVCESIIGVTPALINMERSGMLINVCVPASLLREHPPIWVCIRNIAWILQLDFHFSSFFLSIIFKAKLSNGLTILFFAVRVICV